MNCKKRILAALLAGAMTLSLVACAKEAPKDDTKTSGSPSDTPKTDEIITLQVAPGPSNYTGPVDGWWAEVLKEKLGIALNIIPHTEENLQAYMASGELPDITVFKEYKQIENAVAGDMLLAYDDYKELVPNLYKNAANSLRYYADNVSMGKGKSYAVGHGIQTKLEPKGTVNWGPYLRYDIYKKIGAPAVKTWEDYLGVLKTMQDAYPTNEDGQKVYAFSIWKGWDGPRMSLGDLLGNTNGISYDITGPYNELNVTTNEVKSLFEEDSWYFKTLKLYYDANQMGLLDPDSLTQTFDDAVDKSANSRVLFSWWGWATGAINSAENQNNGIGFMPVMTEDAKILHQGLAPIGVPWAPTVSKTTKYPEQAMKLIDYMYSDEGVMMLENGPQGVIWDLDANGKPVITEDGYAYVNDGEKEMPGGSTIAKTLNFMSVRPFRGTYMLEEYDSMLSRDFWEKPSYAPADTKLHDEWQADYKAEDQIDYLTQRDAIAVAPFAPIPPMPDDIEQLVARVQSIVPTYSWQMATAKDEAEFNKLKAELIEKAEGMGVKTINDWFATEYAKAYELGQKYSK